jgi:ABC-2 type transport system permease protein
VSSRDLIGRFSSSKYFDLVAFPQNPEEVKDLINRGDVILSIEIPTDFSRKLKKGDAAAVQIVFDGTGSNTVFIALGDNGS